MYIAKVKLSKEIGSALVSTFFNSYDRVASTIGVIL